MGNDMYNEEQLAHAKTMSEIRPVTDNEAREILSRFIASHFRKHDREHARFRIPADPAHDDDLRLSQYITETERLRLALETATRERDEARRTVISRDEWRRHAEEQLADVLRLRFLGIEFASQYGDRALACKYDNSCDDSGREPACIPCAFRHALGLMGVN